MFMRLIILSLLAMLSFSASAQAAKSEPMSPQLTDAATNPLVQDNLAVIYAEGRGVPQDYAKAAVWFRKAAEQGDAYAQYSLGYLHSQGLGVERSYAEAAKWYYKAAMQGDAKSQYHLGTFYYLGMGVPKSHEMAVDWFTKAAERGDPKAKYYLTKISYRPEFTASATAMVADHTQHTVENGLGVAFLQGAGASVGAEAAYFWVLVPLMALAV
jgi:TPR repeat protein